MTPKPRKLRKWEERVVERFKTGESVSMLVYWKSQERRITTQGIEDIIRRALIIERTKK